MNEKKILCPRCRRIGKLTTLGKVEHIDGRVSLLMWCKKCREEIRIVLDSHS